MCDKGQTREAQRFGYGGAREGLEEAGFELAHDVQWDWKGSGEARGQSLKVRFEVECLRNRQF